MRHALVAAVLALPSLAAARPITAGVELGLNAAKANEASGAAPGSSVGLFARIGLTPRLAAQLELQRIHVDAGYGYTGDLKTGTALLVVELGRSGNLVPLLMVGAGIDRASKYAYPNRGTHIEGGFGLEYRAAGGFTLGLDARMGGRSLDDDDYVIQDTLAGTQLLWAPSPLQPGEYRSARLRFGVQF